MLVYLCVSFLASGFLYLAERFLAAKKKIFFLGFFCSSIAVFCVMAGGRDLTVGVDVLVYGQHAYNAAFIYDLPSYGNVPMFSGWGLLYLVFSWMTARLTSDFSAYLICIEMLAVVPVYLACHSFLKEKSFIGILIYGFLFFPSSLNMMRQATAMGFVLLAIVAALRNKAISFIVFIFIASLLHTTALVALPAYPIVLLSRSHPVQSVVLGTLGLVVLFCAFDIVNLLVGSFAGKYSVYTTGAYADLGGGTHPNMVLTACFILGVLSFCFMQRGERPDRHPVIMALLSLCIVGLFGMWLSTYSFHLYRIGYYYLYAVILLAPVCLKSVKRKGRQRELLFIFISLALIIHVDYYLIIGSHDVLPYVMNWEK